MDSVIYIHGIRFEKSKLEPFKRIIKQDKTKGIQNKNSINNAYGRFTNKWIKDLLLSNEIGSFSVALHFNATSNLKTIQDFLIKLGIKPHVCIYWKYVHIFSLNHVVVRRKL